MQSANFELEIKPIKGHFNKNYDSFGKMDPFILVKYETKQYKSDVAKKQGQDPKWTKSIIVPVTSAQIQQDRPVVIQAYDEDPMSNDLIGEIVYKLSQIQSFPRGSNIIQLYDTSKKQNEVGWIEVQFELREAVEPPKPVTTSTTQANPTTTSTTKPSKPLAPTAVPTKLSAPVTGNTTELVIRNIRAHFNKDHDLIGKQDPFFVFSLEKTQVRTEIAKNAGTDPKWLEATTLYATSQQIAQDQAILIEAFDEDVGGSDYLGETTLKLSQIRPTPDTFIKIPLYNKNDKKKLEIGWIGADFELKGNLPQKLGTSPQQYATTTSTNTRNRSVGTFVVNPIDGRLDSVSDQQACHLVFVHGDTAYQTADSEGPGRKPVFKDLISFQQLEGENVIVRCFDNDLQRGGLIGEGIIPIANLPRNYRNPLRVELTNAGRRTGEINVNVDLFPEYVFKNPVKVYNTLTINRGDYISKKIKYSNPDSYPKNLLIQSDNRDIVLIKTERLTIPAHSFGEIRFKISAPTTSQQTQDVCCVNIIIEDSKVPEESLLFRVKGI